MIGIGIGVTLKRYISGLVLPDPDRLLDTRSELEITDSIGGASATITRFPHVRLDHVSYGSNFGLTLGYTHNPSGDWTVLLVTKGVSGRDAQNYIQLANINGNAQNYIRVLETATPLHYAYFAINNTWQGGAKYLGAAGSMTDDFSIYGMSWDNTAQEVTTIHNGFLQTVSVGASVNSGSSEMNVTVSSSRVAQVGMILIYDRKLTSQEISDIASGDFPSDSIDYLLYGNGDKDLIGVATGEDILDALGQQTDWSFGPPSDVYDFYNDDEVWMGYLIKNGFTQRGTFQIPYLPGGTKGASDDIDDIEHIASGVVHNMANCYIDGNPDNHSMDWGTDADKIYAIFDKSNRTLWKSSIETANDGKHYVQNDDGNYTLWHPDEMNEDFVNAHAETDHDGHLFFGLRKSGTDITGITKIAVYKENQT